MNLSEVIKDYHRLKKIGNKKDIIMLKNSVVNEIQKYNNKHLIFNNPKEVMSFIDILFDTGKIFSIYWIRKTDSSKAGGKKAGEIDVMAIKKISGYVKGTSKKISLEEERIPVWRCGKLQNEGYGNWRAPFVKDIVAISFKGAQVGIQILNRN